MRCMETTPNDYFFLGSIFVRIARSACSSARQQAMDTGLVVENSGILVPHSLVTKSICQK